MNWGYRVLVVVVVFVVAMSAMVYIAMRQTNEMIDEDYYVKELHYQNQIDAQKRLQALPDQLLVTDTLGALRIVLPSTAASGITDGFVNFIRPSDQKKDFKLAFSDNDRAAIIVPKANLMTGAYKLRISWKSNGLAYYKEQNLTVN